jgi:hypothetical protein
MRNIHFSTLLILLPRAAAELTHPPPPDTPLRRRSGQDVILRRNVYVHGRLQVRLDQITSGPKLQTDCGISRNMVYLRTLCFD